MRFAVAIVSPSDHHDISGGAFNEVAEALHHALVALGHDSVLTNRLDLDERRTIVLGGNLLVQYALEPPNCRTLARIICGVRGWAPGKPGRALIPPGAGNKLSPQPGPASASHSPKPSHSCTDQKAPWGWESPPVGTKSGDP